MTKSIFNKLLNRFGIHLSVGKDPRLTHVKNRILESTFETFELIAESLITKAKLTTFIQVGANDGIHNDGLGRLLQKYPLQGVMVEPQPHAAALLRQRYAGREGIHIVEAAVGSHAGKLTLWRTSGLERHGNTKLDALTTADRALLERQLRQMNITCNIEPLEVPVMPLSHILEQHRIAGSDIVVIDTEGMDRIVLDQVAFDDRGPAVIQFESVHLDSDDLSHCYRRLASYGYRFNMTERDVIAVHPIYVGLLDA
jgi:FkbM family methyltransferase